MNNKKSKSKKGNVLVTGAAGFLGSHVCDALLEKGYTVFGLSCGSEEKIRHLKDNKKFTFINEDIANFEKVLAIFKKIKIEGVFHVAALHSPVPIDSPFPFFESNVKGTLNVLEACRLQGIKKFIYSSSMSVYGKNVEYLPVDEKHPVAPYDFYSLTKLMGEKFCHLYAEQYKLEVVILRYVGIYGSRRDWGAFANFVGNATNNKPLKILRNISWDVVYVKDVAHANISAFELAGKIGFDIINIGTGKEVNIKELTRLIVKMSGSQSKIEFADNLPLTPSSHFYYDVTKAKRILRFTARPIEEALLEYMGEVKNNL